MKIAVIISIFFAQPAFSQEPLKLVSTDTYETVLAGNTKVNITTGDYNNFFVNLPAPSMDDVQKILSKLNQLNADYGPALTVPESLKLKIWSQVGPEIVSEVPFKTSIPAAHYDIERNTMTTGTQFRGLRADLVETSLAVSVHEYAHVLFSNALENSVPKFAAYLRQVREARVALDRKSNVLFGFDLVCKDGKIKDPEYVKKIYANYLAGDPLPMVQKACEELVRIEAIAKNFHGRRENFKNNFFEMSKYHELFADTLAAVDADDLEIMVVATGGEASRSFSKCLAAPPTEASDAYAYFGGTRCEIGKLYNLAKAAKMTKAEFIGKIFKTFAAAIADSSHEYPDGFYVTYLGTDADAILTQRLKREFAGLLQHR